MAKKKKNNKKNSKKNNGKKINKKILAIILAILIVAATIIAFLIIRRPDLESIKNSVVKIEVYDENKELMGTGSGFCAFESNYIITNYHVIEGARYIKIIDDDNKKYDINNIEVYNGEKDLAVISGDFKFNPIPISNKELKVGQEVTAIGSPKGQLNTVSTGVISNADDEYQIRITTPISPGSSGGVLLDDKYKVIGVTYAGFDAIDAQNINYAISVKYIKEMKKWLDNEETFELKNIDSGRTLDLKNPSFNRSVALDLWRHVDSIESFYNYTSTMNGFKETLKNTDEKWYEVFDSYSSEEKYECLSLFNNFDKIESNDKEKVKAKNPNKEGQNIWGLNVSERIQYYSLEQIVYEFIIEKYQYIIILAKINNFDNNADITAFIDSLPLENQQILILKYCLLYKDINYLTPKEKEEVYYWIKNKYKNDDNQYNDNYYIELIKRFGYRYTQNGDYYTFYWE